MAPQARAKAIALAVADCPTDLRVRADPDKLRQVLLNLLSLGAAYGLVVLFWQHGWGSDAVFGIPETGAITFWVPLLIFAFLYGLSMDYEVFILARIREEYDATGNTDLFNIRASGHAKRQTATNILTGDLLYTYTADTGEVTVHQALATARDTPWMPVATTTLFTTLTSARTMERAP